MIAERVPPHSLPARERSPALSTAEPAGRTPLLTLWLVGWVPGPLLHIAMLPLLGSKLAK